MRLLAPIRRRLNHDTPGGQVVDRSAIVSRWHRKKGNDPQKVFHDKTGISLSQADSVQPFDVSHPESHSRLAQRAGVDGKKGFVRYEQDAK
jgi:hypothetical protein